MSNRIQYEFVMRHIEQVQLYGVLFDEVIAAIEHREGRPALIYGIDFTVHPSAPFISLEADDVAIEHLAAIFGTVCDRVIGMQTYTARRISDPADFVNAPSVSVIGALETDNTDEGPPECEPQRDRAESGPNERVYVVASLGDNRSRDV